jgi:hypothetical protein
VTDVEVPFDNPGDQAVLLLAAAEELDLGAGAVKTSEGKFIVPEEVYQRAFPEKQEAPERKAEPEQPRPPEQPRSPEQTRPPKKAPAKKSAKKK